MIPPPSSPASIRGRGSPQVIPATMAKIVQQGMDAGRLTQGALDVTVGPLVNLWGFPGRTSARPAAHGAEQIAQARERSASTS